MTTKRYFVTGRVQGVGFRHFTCKKANELQLCGWVRNLADGRVEVLAAGSQGSLGDFENFLQDGPMLAEVREVKITQENADFDGDAFDIL